MKMKHTVKITENFTHTFELGAMMCGDTALLPARQAISEFKLNESVQFNTKKQAIAFCKFHGFNRCLYLGKV